MSSTRVSKWSRNARARLLGVLSILLAISWISSQAAYAASYVMKDSKGDTYGIGPDGQQLVPKPSVKGDITSVRTTHTAKSINVVIHTQGLRRSNLVEIDIMTSAKHHRHFMLTVMTFPGSKIIDLTTRAGREIPCPGLRGRLDLSQAAVRLHVPRRCLDDPRWIRTGAMVMTVAQIGDDPMTIDVGGKRNLTERWWEHAKHLPYGPRVHVG